VTDNATRAGLTAWKDKHFGTCSNADKPSGPVTLKADKPFKEIRLKL
jgi:hypothetical protein